MSDADLFYPPTKEELDKITKKFPDSSNSEDLFYPPTPEEMGHTPPEQVAMNTIKAGLAGGAQGATLGFADELGAALASPFSDKSYAELRDELRAKQKTLQEQSPGVEEAGELAGAFLSPVKIPLVGKLAETGAGQAMMKNVLGRLAARSAEGAAIGGTAALGRSEADLTQGEYPQALQDVQMGGELGAAVPLGMSAAASLPGAVGKLANVIPGVNTFTQAYEHAAGGYPIADPTAVARDTLEKAKGLTQEIAQGRADVGKQLGAVRQTAADTPVNFSLTGIDDTISKLEDVIKNPNNSDDTVKQSQDLLNYLKNLRYGKEQEKTIPGYVTRGETLPSGEESAVDALKTKQAQMGAQTQLGEPESTALAKLKERFTGRELTSEQPQTTPFKTPEEATSTTGMEGLKVIGPEGEQMAQLVKDIKPGEIKVVTDPSTGKKVAAFMDEASGKVYTKPVSDEAAQTLVKINPSTTVMERPGLVENKSLGDLQTIRNELETMGEKIPYKTEAGRTLSELSKNVSQTLKGSSDEQAGLEKLYQKYNQALEESRLKKPFTGERLDTESITRKLARKIRGLEASGPQTAAELTADTDKLVSNLRQANPELADKVEKTINDSAAKFNLAAQSTPETLKIAGPKALLGYLPAWLVKGGAMTRNARDAAANFASRIDSKFGNTGTKVSTVLKKIATDESMTNQRRNALIFSLMQDPSSREMLRDQDVNLEAPSGE